MLTWHPFFLRNARDSSSVLLVSILNDINVIKKIKKTASMSSRKT
jgi:hypothetical protein